MKLSTREDIEAPIDAVFDHLSDFPHFERLAVRHGASVRRLVGPDVLGKGAKWEASFRFRGRQREMEIEVVEFERPERLVFLGNSKNLSTVFSIELVSFSPNRTRMNVVLDSKPKTLPTRLMMQSLKVARTKVTKRFKLRIADFARSMEAHISGQS